MLHSELSPGFIVLWVVFFSFKTLEGGYSTPGEENMLRVDMHSSTFSFHFICWNNQNTFNVLSKNEGSSAIECPVLLWGPFLAFKVHSCAPEKVKEITVCCKPKVFCFLRGEAWTLPTVSASSKRNRRQKSPLQLSSRGSATLRGSQVTPARFLLWVSAAERVELPGNAALWFLHWSGCICATCWWHDWNISSCSALALLITLLNITTGEALLEAAVTCLSNGVHWLLHSTLLSDISAFEWATSEAIQWEHAAGLLGGPELGWEPHLMDCQPRPIELHELGDQRKVRQRCSSAHPVGQRCTKADSDQWNLFDYSTEKGMPATTGALPPPALHPAPITWALGLHWHCGSDDLAQLLLCSVGFAFPLSFQSV